jgi:hypothetical protein
VNVGQTPEQSKSILQKSQVSPKNRKLFVFSVFITAILGFDPGNFSRPAYTLSVAEIRLITIKSRQILGDILRSNSKPDLEGGSAKFIDTGTGYQRN